MDQVPQRSGCSVSAALRLEKSVSAATAGVIRIIKVFPFFNYYYFFNYY